MSAADDFLRKIVKSELLNREQVQMALRTLAEERREDVDAVRDHLIEQGRLTRFQAYKLSQGITVGLVLGPYHVLAPLGRGGMGTVYLARDTRSGRPVALKILPPKMARREERLLARFNREKELSQKVKHPHLARTLEADSHDDIHFIAMEYIPGQTLYRLVTSQGPLSVARAAHLIAEVASALASAHGQGVIHRDMKPSNIMVTPNDHAKVLDLGLAYTQGEEVEDVEVVGGRGYIVGSIDYMAPEQTRDPTNVDGRADLYALGCCLYFALTGKPPFTEGVLLSKVKSHRREAPVPLDHRNPQVPEAFAALVHKLLAKSPAARFASADELATALAPWRTGATQPLDSPGDAAFQQAVREVVDGWTAPDQPVKETPADAALFHVDAEVNPAPPEIPMASMAGASERTRPQFWLVVLLAVWVGLLLICVLGTCVFSGAK